MSASVMSGRCASTGWPASHVDKVDGGRVTHQDGPLILTGETDRVYAATHPVTVTDPRLERRITLTGVDSNQTVVWNPFGDKAAGMADLGDAWPEFVCVELASVLDRSRHRRAR